MYPTLLFGDERRTPDEMAELTARLAGALVDVGVGEGDVVAVMLRNEPIYVAAALACRLLGAYLCSINWHFKASEAGWILADSGARVLLIHDDLVAQVEEAIPPGVVRVGVRPRPRTLVAHGVDPARAARREGVIDGEAFLRRGAPVRAPRAAPRLPMPYTSGTTGRPKGVRRVPVPAGEASSMAEAWRGVMRVVYGVHPGARCLLSAPLYHSAPMSYATACCAEGALLVLQPRFDAEETLATIERERISHLYLVPAMYQRLLRLPPEVRGRHDLSSIRHVGSTGSPCSPEVKRAMIAWWGPVITESYASSEAGYVTFIDADGWLRRPGSAGRAVGPARVAILDDERRPLPAGQVGLIYARQPAYPDFTYVNADDARRAIAAGDLFTLGDVGWLDEQGYLYVTDRKADMVISGGVNVYPAEIEAQLAAMPGVADCAVFGVPSEEFGEALAAAVEPCPGASLAAADVIAFLRGRLAGYKVPRVVVFHERLPREDTGKIFKARLREPYWAGLSRRV